MSKSTYTSRSSFVISGKDYVGNGIYRKKLKAPMKFDEKTDRLTIESFQIYNSFYNITRQYDNNTLIYTWINGETMTITLPDGYYETEPLDYTIKQKLIEKGWYYYNADKSQYNFCHSFEVIENIYSNRISLFYFPDATLFAQKNFVVPDGVNWTVPQQKKHIKIELQGKLNAYFGQKDTVFPKQADINATSNLFYDSVKIPEVLIIDYLTLCCNLINSPYNQEADFLTQIRINNTFGGLVTMSTGFEHKYNINTGTYQEIIIAIKDDLFNNINLKDPQMTINLIIERELPL
jgi:hypothetical protein